MAIITANNNGLVGRSRSSCSDGRRHATGPLRAPETRGFRPTTRTPWRARCRSTDIWFARSCILSRLWTGVTIRLRVRFSIASFLFDPGKLVYEREITFESRFGVAFPAKWRSSSFLLPPPPFAEQASSSGGGLPRNFTITRTRGWPDTHRRLAHDSFVGDFAVRSAKSGTRLSARYLKF